MLLPPPLDVEDPIEVSLIRLMREQSLPTLTFPDIDRRYVPGRALFFSSLVHELALVVLLVLTFAISRTKLARPFENRQLVELGSKGGLVYLPVLGGGDEGKGREGGSPGLAVKKSPAPSRSSKGVAFPGPQPILSNPPEPTTQAQTVLHPAPEKQSLLKQFVPLPNIVKMGHSALTLPKNLMAGTRPDLPDFHPAMKPSAAAPKIELPASTPELAAIRPAPEPLKHAAAKPMAAPKISRLATDGTDLDTIVSLSPTPTMPEPAPKLPEGEVRGRFAVSPEPNLTKEPTPGSLPQGSAGSPAIGNKPDTHAGNAVGGIQIGAGNGTANQAAAVPGGGGVGSGIGTGQGSGKGGTANGTEEARGSASGPGVGAGPGSTSAGGAGAGSGSGKGSLSGITIQGAGNTGGSGTGSGSISGLSVHGANGSYGSGVSVKANASIVRFPSQTAYGMTVVSLAESGGGLPDFGVFKEEKVYTVYLDMRQTTDDPAPSYTLQYAPMLSAGQATTDQGPLTPPYPLNKPVPPMNSELMRRYLRDVVIVYAILQSDGKLQQLSVMQSPDARFNPPILATLRLWTFRPAQMNGKPVGVKVLVGIPVLPFE
jgi:Gram-negative bacterial TonB protein C-terminal